MNHVPDFSSLDTLIGNFTDICGTVTYTGSIHLRGTLKGDLKRLSPDPHSTNKPDVVVITGVLDGSMDAEYSSIDGIVIGDVVVEKLVMLGEHASVKGNLTYGELVVVAGATIEGTLTRIARSEPDVPKTASRAHFKQIFREFFMLDYFQNRELIKKRLAQISNTAAKNEA
jgi:cytoskeletal protein CcmA (bactofilin family)